MIQSNFETELSLPPAAACPPRMTALGLSLAFGLAATVLCFGARPGVNWLLTGGGLAAVARLSGGPVRWSGASARCGALAVALCGGAVATADPLVHTLLALTGLWLGAIAVLGAVREDCLTGTRGGLLRAPLRAVALVWVRVEAAASVARQSVRSDRWRRRLRGATMAVPVVAVFFWLLSAADPTFERWRDSGIRWLCDTTDWARAVCFVMLSSLALGVLQRATTGGARAEEDSVPERFRAAEPTVVLGAVAALFGLFLALQAGSLFGNPGARPGSGLSYSEAVHRGFVEITVVVCLCTALLIGLNRRTARDEPLRWMTRLGHLTLAECALLLVSAAARLVAYESAYGYTEARLAVLAWIVFLAGVVCFVARETAGVVDLGRLRRRCLLGAATLLAAWAYASPAAWIAAANLERSRRGHALDEDYYASLADTPGARAAVISGLDQLAPALRARLEVQLRDAYVRQSAEPAEHWYEWNATRAADRAALERFVRETAR